MTIRPCARFQSRVYAAVAQLSPGDKELAVGYSADDNRNVGCGRVCGWVFKDIPETLNVQHPSQDA